MDRPRRLRVRIPGLSFIVAAALTVALEAAIGIGASISVASGVPSVTSPNLSGATSSVSSAASSAGSTVSSVTSSAGSTVSSVTSSAGSTVSSAAGTATGAASSAVHSVTSAASSAPQSLVKTASNLTSTAPSVGGPGSSAPAGGGSATAAAGSTGSASGSSASSASQAGSAGHGTGSSSDPGSHPAQHPWFVRRLVTRLSGCVEELPDRSQQVLVLAAGIGTGHPNSPSRVAQILHLSRARELRIENSAVTALEKVSRHSSCQSAGGAVPVSALALGLEPGLTLISGPQAGAVSFVSAAQALAAASGSGHKSAVRALHLNRHHRGGASSSGSSPVERSAIGSPAAAGSISPWIYVLIGLLAGGSFLLIGRQRFRGRPSAAAASASKTGAAGLVAAPPPAGHAAGSDAAASWDPPATIVPMAAVAADPPASIAPDSPAPVGPESTASPEDPAAAFVPLDFAPTAPEKPAFGAGDFIPASPEGPTPSQAPPEAPAAIPAEPEAATPPAPAPEPAPRARRMPSHAPGGRPRVQAGRNWLRRHRQLAAIIGAVAGASLAMMMSTAERSARLIARRRRRWHR